MRAIVYTSNTGSTESYAKLLSHKIVIPAYSMEEAKKRLKMGAEVIYFGWIMAGEIKGYKSAAKRYHVRAVCGVGMGQTGTQLLEVRSKNKIPPNIPVFTLQGNFDLKKLRGVQKIMMNVMVKTAGKVLENKTDRTAEEEDMLDMLFHGSERVDERNLTDVLNWYDSLRG